MVRMSSLSDEVLDEVRVFRRREEGMLCSKARKLDGCHIEVEARDRRTLVVMESPEYAAKMLEPVPKGRLSYNIFSER